MSGMGRREFVALLGGAAAAWPLSGLAEQSAKVLRVGMASANPRTFATWVTFERRMRDLGYVDGENLAVEFIHLGARGIGFDDAMRELVRRGVDAIVISDDIALKAATAASSTIPIIIIAIAFDPVERGFVTSISRPTGNVTGLFFRRPELVAKQMGILRETFPERRHLGIFWDALTSSQLDAAERVAEPLRLQLHPLKLVNPPYDFAGAFRQLAEGPAEMLFVLSSNLFNEQRKVLADLAIQHRLPTMFVSNLYVEAGGLMSYGPSVLGMYRRAAEYVGRIAKGAKPADLPIEQPNKFDFTVNVRTAQAIGVTLPPTLLAIADEVIE